MSYRVAQVLAFTLVCGLCALAQHGESEPGFYKFNYHGDTWTGAISSFDQVNGTIVLTYEHKGKAESFSGIMIPMKSGEPCSSCGQSIGIIDKNGNPAPAQVRVKVGDRITAYYIREGLKYSMRKEDGKRHDEVANANLIFQIKLLDSQKH